MDQGRFRFPNVIPGYVLSALIIIVHFLLVIVSNGAETDRRLFDFIYFIAMWPAAIYFFVCLFQAHQNLREETSGKYPISPMRAVFYNLIPFFQVYWLFRWPFEMAKYGNQMAGEKKLEPWLPGAALIIAMIVGRVAESGFALLINFFILQKLFKLVSESADKNDLLIEKGQGNTVLFRPLSRTNDVTALICLCVMFLVLISTLLGARPAG